MMDSKDIEALVKTTIQTKIVEAFNSAPDTIDKLVQAALNKEVDEHGMKPDGYGRGHKMPYLEWLVGEEIRKAAREAVNEYVSENREHVKMKVRKALADDSLTNGITNFLTEQMGRDYSWNFEMHAKRDN